MRYLRIFIIHFHRVIENRSRSIVWTLLAIFNPLIYLCYWLAVYKSNGQLVVGWSLSAVTSYYLLLTFSGSFLIAHIEEAVAVEDIYEGELVKYLLKPFSYFWNYYFNEIGWRIFQGVTGFIVFLVLSLFFGKLITFVHTPQLIVLTFISIVLAFSLCFIFKMILGMSAFWLTEFRGLQGISEIVILVFGGFIVPIHFFPLGIQHIAYFLPFAYIVYFPVLALQGQLNALELGKVICIQILWIGALSGIYTITWKKGLQTFTGVGQ